MRLKWEKIHERSLQQAVHALISDSSQIHQTISGKNIQIVSRGEINLFGGPDFSNIAILGESGLVIGDAEFHKHSGDWNQHGHSRDEKYNNVILHIVIDHNLRKLPADIDILIIPYEKIQPFLSKRKKRMEPDPKSIVDLQDYALRRLCNRAEEARQLTIRYGIEEAYKVLLREFFYKFAQKRRRPIYDDSRLKTAFSSIFDESIMNFLRKIDTFNLETTTAEFQKILKEKSQGCGRCLKGEIIINCILPLTLAIATERMKYNLLMWFWAVPAVNEYGSLRRRFSRIPQDYFWQQQGMLEFLKEISYP